MRTVYDAIRDIRERAETEHDKGMRFEAASRYYLRNDPLYRNKFSQVWAWADSPYCNGHDIGIDIVAQDADDGTLWAIQCKCYDDGATLTEKELGTFYSAAHHATYPHTMIISTTGRYSANLDKVAREHDTVRIDASKMNDAELDWEPFIYNRPEAGKRVLYEVRPHQRRAIDDILRDFNRGITRGKLIMACGTGKTLTALRFAEEFLGRGGKNGRGAFVLFLAPSISLVSQSLRAWAAQAVNPLKAEVVCSDKTSSKPNEDAWENSLADIPYPADTNAEMVAKHIASKKNPDGLTVVFSTYQSLEVIYEAQHKYRMPDFDLIICDEAHRTTGASKIGVSAKDASAFIRIHDKDYVRGKFRLYMTATPKIYGDKVKKKAQFDDYAVSSMDDADIFGPELHKLSFGEAIDQQLLTDYKPIALTVSTDAIAPEIQREFAGPEGLELDEPARIVGCFKGLSRKDGSSRCAVAFCNTIAESKRMAKYFVDVVNKYAETERALGREVPNLVCRAKHVDGSMSSAERRELLDWLATREETADGRPVCHILFNARCLAEGVDVPSLDAVLFLRPKKSQIDVIQAVGRVMRRSPGKEYGYIILPLVIPAGLDADTALDQSDDFAIIWSVAKALRSHDERMEAVINALQYDADAKPPIEVDFLGADRVEEAKADYDASEPEKHEQMTLDLDEHTLRKAVNALLVKKCGTKVYWQDWAKDIAEIAKVYIERIKRRVCPASAEAPEGEARADFVKFLR
ncbi:MAG: DEAD/DEAH box helicase family protein, partial [bacterium]|nr:DEAD/DEAH box helicase family protein [bacterium]